MTLDQFIQQNNNQGLDFDGAYGFQCVDLVQFWVQNLGGPRLSGNAVDLAEQTHDGWFDWIANSPTGVPSAGDIMVYGADALIGTGDAGHTEIWHDGDVNSYNSFSQNWPTGSVCHMLHHDSYEGVLGWLHPKVLDNQQQSSNQGSETMDNPDDVRDMYRFFLGREASDSEVAIWLGKSWHDCYYQIRDSAEAQAYRNQTAKQVGTLAAQIQSQQATIDELNAELAKKPETPAPTGQPAPTPENPIPTPPVSSPAKDKPSSNSVNQPKLNWFERLLQWLKG